MLGLEESLVMLGAIIAVPLYVAAMLVGGMFLGRKFRRLNIELDHQAGEPL